MKKYLLCLAAIFLVAAGYAQLQTCPTNINFGTGDLSFWSATTGLINGPTQSYPAPNTGLTTIPEYSLSNTGIQVITSPTSDPFGFFPTVPTINGYSYNYSIMLGSSTTSRALGQTGRNPGGFIRAVTYVIDVPPGSTADPYTMTYAYAMVLENGTHNSNEQPLFKATLSTHDSVITCASPGYYLPTFNNAAGGNGGSGTGATLDSATAKANGFTNSPVPFMNFTGNNSNGTLLYDVWTKGWTEVTFDLSPYRGQQVTLTFEADNCRPGAHFAYSYVALRNTCAGLEISGKQIACTNTTVNYSVPALAGATYDWTVPAGWTINSGANSNIINVTVGANGGKVTNHEVNGCADLRDTINIATMPPTAAGRIMSDTTVCSGINTVPLTLADEVGGVLKWITSTDGVTWRDVAVTSDKYTPLNLVTTTRYAAVVQNGPACAIDTSSFALVTVDPQSKGGKVTPDLTNICLNETTRPLLTLVDNTGSVMNWQSSFNSSSWSNFSPAYQNTTYQAGPVTQTAYYRAVVKSGVCPADTSDMATLRFYNVPAPDATIDPENSNICYGKSILLNATITTGTNYAWGNSVPLSPGGSGVVPSVPYSISTTATPKVTSNVVLSVTNAGCPNPLRDTFHIEVTKPIIVNAGNDTAVVINQPLQFNATVNDPNANRWTWAPPFGLNFSGIANPVGLYNEEAPAAITYVVTAETAAGCYGTDTVTVKIFKTEASIFMPSGFTPNHDGRNDVIRPILAGIKQLMYFRVYNRWGQLVFSTSEVNKGWDGYVGGSEQSSQNFVYMVQAIDYTGKVIVKRGSFVLVR
jgi:gliding motility-associated-like protein